MNSFPQDSKTKETLLENIKTFKAIIQNAKHNH